MLYALISDIHSNLEALEAVLKDAREQGARAYLCPGDIVGYGAQPSECLKMVRDLPGKVIAGNHDYAVCNKTDTTYFNTYARKAVEWTAEQLSKQELEYLSGLPLIYRQDDFCLVHGSLYNPEYWEYLVTDQNAFNSFQLLNERILFVGHSHVPWVFSYHDKQVSGSEPRDFTFEPDTKYIVNIGSVGQPRDLDSRASYCLFDPELCKVWFRRIVYDYRITQQKILAARLPEILALRLEMGR